MRDLVREAAAALAAIDHALTVYEAVVRDLQREQYLAVRAKLSVLRELTDAIVTAAQVTLLDQWRARRVRTRRETPVVPSPPLSGKWGGFVGRKVQTLRKEQEMRECSDGSPRRPSYVHA